MLYLAAFFGAVLLVVTNGIARWSDHPNRYGLTAIAGLVVCPVGMVFASPTVMELGLALGTLLILTARVGRRWLFLPLSLAAFAVVFGGNYWYVKQKVDRLLDTYPFESIADRLPELPADGKPPVVPESFTEFESRGYRAAALRDLHENTKIWFVNQPNFGVARMIFRSESTLRHGERTGPPVEQPLDRLTSGGVVEGPETVIRPPDGFERMHADGVLDFVHPDGFGYVKNRRQVAGFQPHQFSRTPEAGPAYRLRALDLVGLVVHPEPVAYVSALLPRMDELREAPTRPLTPFEAAGLAELRGGDDLYARELPGGAVRLLGAVRNAKQCQGCHGGYRGDLLGAFSYELLPGGPRS